VEIKLFCSYSKVTKIFR